MIRCRAEQDKINAEIDRRLLEFQSPKEIALTISTSLTNAVARSRALGLELHRITPAERDLLLLRRAQAKEQKP